MKRICTNCGNEYVKGINCGKTKYCSDDCFKEARRIENRERWRKQNPDWNKGVTKECEWCGNSYEVPKRGAHQSRFCSDYCRDRTRHKTKAEWLADRRIILDRQIEETKKRKEAERKTRIRTKECSECGNKFQSSIANQVTCSADCSKFRKNRLNQLRNSNRLNDSNIVDRDISLRVLYKRDQGRCYICGRRCNYSDFTKDNSNNFISGPDYPSVDHIIPLARGGKHSWDNVRLAHHRCNSLKSDTLPDRAIDWIPDNAYRLARKISPRRKQVKQCNAEGKVIATYESTVEAENKTGLKQRQIQNCARGETKSYKGYVWSYV